MRLTTRSLLSLLLLLSASIHAVASVQTEIERAVKATPLRTATVGISVCDAASGATIGNINGSLAKIPASNMKLLTTGAALHVLGPDYQFTTQLIRNENDLIVIGSGDPAFGDPYLLSLMDAAGDRGIGVEEFLDFWVQPVVASGMTHVQELIIDDRVFDREYVHETWPVEQLNRRYCAEVAGLNFHLNVLHFYPKPRSSRPDVSHFEPHAPWLDIANSATSKTGKDDPNSVWIARPPGDNKLRFYGNVKHTYRTPVPVTVHDMPNFFGRLLAERLRDAGVQVDFVRLAHDDEPTFTGDRIAPVISTPLPTLVQRCNRDSQNLYAEAMLKRIGGILTKQPGSWVNGSAMVRHVVQERLDSPTLATSVRVADGSGLSRDNRVSPTTLTAWLNSFHDDNRLGDIFKSSLATPGQRGTLQRRFDSTDLHGMAVHAKSGYINGVSTLSGYVTAPDGRSRSFSIMLNEIPNPTTLRHARNLQEQIVGIIARDLAAAEVRLGSD